MGGAAPRIRKHLRSLAGGFLKSACCAKSVSAANGTAHVAFGWLQGELWPEDCPLEIRASPTNSF